MQVFVQIKSFHRNKPALTCIGMIDVLPIHSQARGRIFLPFADDDPQTAEIMSKILLFAEDHKIKDPSILSQILG